MTKRKLPQKTPRQLADEHWEFIEGLVLEQFRVAMRLFKEGFTHGYKHGKEDTIENRKNRQWVSGNSKRQ